MDPERAAALQPRWKGQAGFYEVWYLKANAPEEDTSAWLRYTVTAPEAGDPVPQLWAIVDRAGDVTARQATWPAGELTLGSDPFEVELPGGRLAGHGCQGSAEPVAWKLAWEATGAPFWHLPAWAYRLPAPKTKVCTPMPDLAVTGRLEVADQVLELEGAPGQLGHVWGTQHAEAWAWAHGNAGDGPTWEALTAQPALGPWTSPPITVVLLRHAGQTIAFRNPLLNRGEFDLGGFRFQARSGRFRVAGEVTSDHRVAVTYTDPDGQTSFCHNTKRATSRVRLWDDGELVGTWRDQGTTAFEVGDRQADPGTELVL